MLTAIQDIEINYPVYSARAMKNIIYKQKVNKLK